MYDLIYSATFRQRFRKLPIEIQERIRSTLAELKIDPLTRRSGMAIRRLAGFDPKKWRVRVGDYRIVYQVEGNIIMVIEVFPRGRGYRFEIF
jgi:mRNA interferase RelE/StbE